MGNTKIIPRGFGPALVLVLLAGVVGGLGQWWADGGSQAVQLTRCGALLAEAWEAAAVEEVLFRGVLLWACLSWARRRNEAYPRRALRAHRLAGLRAVVDPVGFAVMTSSLIFGLAHLFPEGARSRHWCCCDPGRFQGDAGDVVRGCHGAAHRS